MREEGHALGGGFGQNMCFLCRAGCLAGFTFFGSGARRCEGVRKNSLFVRRFVAELGHRLSCLEKFPYLFVDATDPTVANPILKSWRSLPRVSQHPVTVRNCMLWEAVLQRIANHETAAIPQALIDEQEVFRRMRLSSSSGERWHCSVRLVREFRGCLVHNVCLRPSR